MLPSIVLNVFLFMLWFSPLRSTKLPVKRLTESIGMLKRLSQEIVVFIGLFIVLFIVKPSVNAGISFGSVTRKT